MLSEAGVLPDGSLDQFGAVPAASLHGRAITGNQVSADGLRAFFVSPDPASCGNGNDCAVDPPELYVRENGEKTVLVSQDTLLPQVNGLPARYTGWSTGFHRLDAGRRRLSADHIVCVRLTRRIAGVLRERGRFDKAG